MLAMEETSTSAMQDVYTVVQLFSSNYIALVFSDF